MVMSYGIFVRSGTIEYDLLFTLGEPVQCLLMVFFESLHLRSVGIPQPVSLLAFPVKSDVTNQ